ncbi:MAG: hypothetical protein AAFR46_17780 [Pseudomonadota bacterium]
MPEGDFLLLVVKSFEAQLKKIEKESEALLERIVGSGNGSVITAYERKVSALEREKALIAEKISNGGKPRH